LGDSYAFGYGVEVEQSYGKVFEGLFNHTCTGVRISVINAGVSGYGTVQQQLSFHRLLGALQPDFVIASFTAGNDVDENALFEERLRCRRHRTSSASHVARLLEKVTFPVWFFLANRDADNIEHTISLLKQFESDLDSANAPFVMLIIPSRHQIWPSVEPGSRLLMALGFDELMFRQNHAVEQHFVQDRVPYIDLWPALVAEDTNSPVSFADDSHLNPHGHEIAAGVIERYFRDRFAALVPDSLMPAAQGRPPQPVDENDALGKMTCRVAL
jgi:GDSL-like lipase/acylhydrolase family protein